MSSEQNVRSVGRAVSILQCFNVETPERTFNEIANCIGLSKSTTHRLLGTLEHDRMIEFNDENGTYRLGREVLRLGSVAAAGIDVLSQAAAVLLGLTKETDETSLLIIPNETETLCVRRFDGSSPGLDMFPREGERSPFNCGAGQRVLLAHAPETSWRNIVANEVRPLTQYSLASEAALDHDRSDIIKKGYSLGWEDIALHTCDVAAPVRNGKAEVVAAVSLCGIVQRFSAERLPVLIQAVMEAGNRLSTDLS